MSSAVPQARRIFATSALVLFTAGFSFTLRAAIIGELESQLLAPLDPTGSATRAGELLGVAFLGFAIMLALLPAILIAVFGAVWWLDRRRIALGRTA